MNNGTQSMKRVSGSGGELGVRSRVDENLIECRIAEQALQLFENVRSGCWQVEVNHF